MGETEKLIKEHNELNQRIRDLDKQFQKNKLKRTIKTYLAFVIKNAIIMWYFFEDAVFDFYVIFDVLIGSLFLSIFSLFLNMIIVSPLIKKGISETNTIEKMEREKSILFERIMELKRNNIE